MLAGISFIILAGLLLAICGAAIESHDVGPAWFTGFIGVFLAIGGLGMFGTDVSNMTKGTSCELDSLSAGAVVELISEPVQQDKQFLCFVRINEKDTWAIKLESAPAKKSVVTKKDKKNELVALADEQPAQSVQPSGVTIENPLVPPAEKK